MKSDWDDDMKNVFSTNRRMMSWFGLWPMQKNNVISKIKCALLVIPHSLAVPYLASELVQQCGDPKDDMQRMLYIQICLQSVVNTMFPRAHRKKMTMNIQSANDDWHSFKVDQSSYQLMKKYARLCKVVNNTQLVVGVFLLTMTLIKVVSIRIAKSDSTKNVTLSEYLYPVGCIFQNASIDKYVVLMIIQQISVYAILLSIFSVDSFFVNISVHLSVQLEILKRRFIEFRTSIDKDEIRVKELGALVTKHCHLIELSKNIQDAFYICNLFQLLFSIILMSVVGFRLSLSAGKSYDIEIPKDILVMIYYNMKCALLVAVSDGLERNSEAIFDAIYEIPWYEVSPNFARNVIMVLARSAIPIRLSAGNLFYITRGTLIDIWKTVVSFISLLHLTLYDAD